jgi:hypothetical protein
VAVGFHHGRHVQLSTDLEKPFVFVRRVDEYGLAAATTASDVHVVLNGTYDEAMNLDGSVRPDNLYPLHAS